jgi:hypothetical protein
MSNICESKEHPGPFPKCILKFHRISGKVNTNDVPQGTMIFSDLEKIE